MSKSPTESRSLSPDPDEDADYLAALRLSKELNDEHSLPLNAGAPQPNHDLDVDYAYAVKVQFGNSDGSQSGAATGSTSNYASRWSDAPQSKLSPWALDEQEPRVAEYHEENPIRQMFGTLAAFLQHVKSARCSVCGQVYFRSEFDVSTLIKNWNTGNSVLTSCLKCTNCSSSSCITCTSQPFAKLSVIGVQGKQIIWCCVGGRLLLLWLLLCGLDEHFSATKFEEVSLQKRKQQTEPPHKKRAGQQGRGGGVGFDGPSQYHTPSLVTNKKYGSDWEEKMTLILGDTFKPSLPATHSTNNNSKAKALDKQNAEDRFYRLYLLLVEGLLPSFERNSIFDLDPPGALAEMLAESKIMNYCTELLRNDSLQDATNRKNLYQALVSFLRTLGEHYYTASGAIYNERSLRDNKFNLLVLSFHEFPGVSNKKTTSIMDSLSNLNTQSELVLQELKAMRRSSILLIAKIFSRSAARSRIFEDIFSPIPASKENPMLSTSSQKSLPWPI
jgi:hypothetical protein